MLPTSQHWVKPDYWEEAKRHLSTRDAVLEPVINMFQHEQLRSRGNAFETLARAIVGQQISVKAAESIWKKLENALGEVSPETIQIRGKEELRGLGLSSQKVLYLNIIADAFTSRRIVPQSWHYEPDEHIIKELTAIKGIGRWTAEMFLIFYLMKPDVLPLADIGLQKAIEKLYNGGGKLTIHEMNTIAEPWRPYRTVATWYLWRSLDPVPVEY